jgi:hypothetical protein
VGFTSIITESSVFAVAGVVGVVLLVLLLDLLQANVKNAINSSINLNLFKIIRVSLEVRFFREQKV